jgi:secretion/DNA translocation related TadE-like protein
VSPERGTATLVGTYLAGAVLVLALVLASLSSVVALRHRAGVAADLAALAGAQAWVGGQPPCPAARVLARANGGRVMECGIEADAVRVLVQSSASRQVLGRAWTLTVRRSAWAGPVTGVSAAEAR